MSRRPPLKARGIRDRQDGTGWDGTGRGGIMGGTVMALAGCPLWPAPEALAVSASEEKIAGHFSEQEEEEEEGGGWE